jgi:TM2 domain-containing membrane protein YozV
MGIGWLLDCLTLDHWVRECNEDKERLLGEPPVQQPYRAMETYPLALTPLGVCLGFHHFYLRRHGWGIAYSCTMGLLGVGWFADLFRMPLLVRRANEEGDSVQRVLHLDDAYVLWISPLGLLGAHHYYDTWSNTASASSTRSPWAAWASAGS